MTRRLRAVVVAVLAVLVTAGAVGIASASTSARSCKTVTMSMRAHGVTQHRRSRVCETATIAITASSLPATGGTVTLRYSAGKAATCTLTATPSFWTGRNPAPVRCQGSYTLHVPAASLRRAWSFRFTARNRYGESVTVMRSLVATAAPANLTITPYTSSNWSGYALEGGGITGTAGTFTVPTLNPTALVSDTSEWVGIDGVTNQDLIQAGVHEHYDPSTQKVSVWAWWEELPAPEQLIDSMTVQPGDTITVTIHRVAGTTWQIALTDNTAPTPQSFTIEQPYAGPATSAEWIVEAPSIDNTIATLGAFTPVVTFSGLAVNGVQMALDRLWMVDSGGGDKISSPSVLDPTGFNVAYGPDAPNAP